MLNFSKIKILTIFLFVVLAIYFSLPTFIYNDQQISEQIINVAEKKSSFKSYLLSFLPSTKVNMGLDLQGGSQLMIEVDFDYYLTEQINNLNEELTNIFNENSIRSVPQAYNDKIAFNLYDNEQKKQVINLIRKVDRFIKIDEDDNQFKLFYDNKELVAMKQRLIAQSIEIVRRRVDENGTKEPSIQAQGDSRILLQVPGVQNSDELKQLLGKTAKLTFHFLAGDQNNLNPQNFTAYDQNKFPLVLKKEVVLSGDMLVDASATYHEGQPAVFFRFNAIGAKKFAQVTRDNIGKIFAIVLDGNIVTAPKINSAITQGSGVISGNFSTQEAGQVALLLRAGALLAPLKIIEERTVGPSLGLDSIRSGKISSVMGMFFVGIFMIIFYGLFGLIANVAMIVNVAIIIASLALLNATLTLPGIAGIVLTMGMAVDANVLIFERIKEELREKRSVFQAVEMGFDQAYRTIIDSNLTTLIVAFFLFVFGNGSVKGFAVTLSIGIISSMFSAILLTRMMIAIWLKRTRPKLLKLI